MAGQTSQTLIVARMSAEHAERVAGIFAESDAGDLPGMLGVRRRSLFRFHDVYVHLIESDQDVRPGLEQVRGGPLFQDVNSKLAPFVLPYDPATWAGPQDAMAERFYHWRAR
ncbi:cyclase [Catenulispora sp. GAS73]|uniref:TcmI family type II polyketide cyclase n=1 Tax=Catenulispora sp. GAS73 TaxID=3156269 RepID=UPI0035164D86